MSDPKPAQPGIDRVTAISLLGLMVAGAVARVAGLGDYYLSPDEAAIMAIARQPTLARVFTGTLAQAHPPFHYFLMHFWPAPGNGIMWLRVSSLIPGLLLIPAAYFAGKKALGPAAAWAMAFLAAFGNAPLILSEVIRPYAPMGLLLMAGLWFWFDFIERPRVKPAAGYGACMVAALAFHYSAGLFIAGAGLAGAAWLLARRRPARELAVWIAAHLPAAAAAVALYCLHLSRILELQRSWMEGYLGSGFPGSALDLLRNLNTILTYFFLPPLAPAFAALVALGLVALIRRRRYPALLFIGSCFLAALALNLTGAYPLSGLRHCFWLFGPVALLASAPIEFLEKPDRNPARIPTPTFSRVYLPFLVFALAGLIAGLYAHYDYLRLIRRNQVAEFAIRQDFFNGVLARLDRNSTPNDLILTARQTADLLRFVAGPDADRRLSPRLSRLRLNGRDYIYAPEIWNYQDRNELGDALREALALRPTPPGSSVIILNVGYNCESLLLTTYSLFRGDLLTGEQTKADFLLIVRMPADQIRKALIK